MRSCTNSCTSIAGNTSNQAAVIGISVAATLLTIIIALASIIITLCVLITRIKRGQGKAIEEFEDPYYSSIHDLVELKPVTNIGWIGVNTNRNQAYGTRAVMGREENTVAATSDGKDVDVTAGGEGECLPTGDKDTHQDIAAVAVRHSLTDTEYLDEDGYVDVYD